MSQRVPGISLGTQFETEAETVTEPAALDFASQFDPQPMHLHHAAAADGPFGRLTASGWHTLSLTMKLIALRKPFGETPLLGVGVDKISFLKPLYPSTTIFVRAEVVGYRQSRKQGRAFVTLDVKTCDRQTEEVIVEQTWTLLVPVER